MHVDLLMCIHAYACVYAYAYTYMHTRIDVHVYMRMYIYAYEYAYYMHTYMHTRVDISPCSRHVNAHIHKQTISRKHTTTTTLSQPNNAIEVHHNGAQLRRDRREN